VFAEQHELRITVEKTLMRSRHPGQPSHAQELLSEFKKIGRSNEELEEVLIAIVEEECPNIRDRSRSDILCIRTVYTLGELRSEAAIPVLSTIARTEHDVLRNTAIGAIANAGGPEMLEFAREVVSNGAHYIRLDRYRLYKTLVGNLEDITNLEWNASRAMVNRFLLKAVIDETDAGNVIVLDEYLKKSHMNYRMSYERERTLERIQSSSVDRYRRYVAEELSALRRSPETERTHVEVEGRK
jgi:hypothetical protein